MNDNNKSRTDELISRIFNDDLLLRNYLKSSKPNPPDAMTEQQKNEQLFNAITDLGKASRKS